MRLFETNLIHHINKKKNGNLRKIVVIFLTVWMLFALSSNMFAKHRKITLIGHVIGVEMPDLGWAMEFQSLRIFYVHIDKVLKGKSRSRFVRIAYGYNPTSSPQDILPPEMFDGSSRWQFELTESSDFNAKISLGKEPGDEADNKNSKIVKGSDLFPKPDSETANKEFFVTQITLKCVPVAGYEKEAAELEKLKTFKGYWLDFEKKSFKRF